MEALVDRVLAIETSLFWGGIVTWFMLAALVGAIASGRGRSGFGFFLIALLCSSLVTVIVLLFLPDFRHQRLLALESRLAALDGQSASVAATHAASPGAPVQPASRGGASLWVWLLVGVIALLSFLGGVSMLGQSANSTFTRISSDR